jgi:hypothetical protein
MLSIKKWSLQIVECPIVEMQFYFSGGAIEADNKGVARTKALNIVPSTGQPGFLCLAFLPMASTASHLPSLAGRPHLSSSGWLFCRKQNPEIIAVSAGSACASLNLRRSPEAPVPRRPMRLLSGSLES